MIVCRAYWKVMLHSTYTKEHPVYVFTVGRDGIGSKDDCWKKLFSRGMYGLYWRQ